MRVALFGGTFDPIHRGHLVVAAAAADEFGLERVIFAPTGRQPLKSAAPVAAFRDRIAMARIACDSAVSESGRAEGRFVVSAMDAPRADGRPNYTIDLVAGLLESAPSAELFVLTGADSFLTIRRWREPERLLALCDWIVVSRPGSKLEEQELGTLGLTVAERARVHLLPTVHEDVSATELRRRLAAGEPCGGLIPRAVAGYIREHGLYRGSAVAASG